MQYGEILDSFAERRESSIFLQRGEILDTFVRGGTLDISFEERGILGSCERWNFLRFLLRGEFSEFAKGGNCREFCKRCGILGVFSSGGGILDIFAMWGPFAGWGGGGGSIDIFATWGMFSIFLQKGWKSSMFCIRVEARGIFAGGDP